MRQGDALHLCGLAHGAAGVALAFEAHATLSSATPYRWRAEAAAARLFERSHFDAAACSWADLRGGASDGGTGPGHPRYWCHGSIGIAQERLRAQRSACDDPTIAADLAAALSAARRETERICRGPAGPGAGFSANASQCHGLSGIIDLLVDTGTAADLALAREVAGFIRLDASRPEGYRCGNPGGEPAPGLMVGLADIAWGLLRAGAPGALPVARTPFPIQDPAGAVRDPATARDGAAGGPGPAEER
jgi:lantibiotic modifying enzyme